MVYKPTYIWALCWLGQILAPEEVACGRCECWRHGESAWEVRFGSSRFGVVVGAAVVPILVMNAFLLLMAKYLYVCIYIYVYNYTCIIDLGFASNFESANHHGITAPCGRPLDPGPGKATSTSSRRFRRPPSRMTTMTRLGMAGGGGSWPWKDGGNYAKVMDYPWISSKKHLRG